MTKKIDERSETKQRIRQFLKDNGIDMRTAEKTCGFKPGYLSAGGVVGSDKLAQFIMAYPSADLHFVVTGTPDKMREKIKALYLECQM